METDNRKVITPERLLSHSVGSAAKRAFLIIAESFFLGLFCLLILIILGLLGLLIDIAAVVIFVLIQKRIRNKAMNAYLRILPALEKKSGLYTADNDMTYPYSCIAFPCNADGSGVWVDSAEYDEFEAAKPGDYFYVAFYRTDNRPFICYSCERNIPDRRLEVRQ